jgi:hypothetical protein
MPVCIAGMHRSGTSMVTRLLHLCGLYLGPEDELLPPGFDNPEGFWEHAGLMGLNEAILHHFGGAWELVPTAPEGWETQPALEGLRARAHALLERFRGHEPWGWKDPRNSLTLPFWKQLLPDLRVVICARNPLEVAISLTRRNSLTLEYGLNLWLTYQQCLLATVPRERRVVTHYDAYFHDAPGELRRVLQLLDIPVTDEAVTRASAAVSLPMRHSSLSAGELAEVQNRPELVGAPISTDLVPCYAELCAEAGPIFQACQTKIPSLPEALERVRRETLTVLRLEAELVRKKAELVEKERRLVEKERQLAEAEAARRSWEERLKERRYQIADRLAGYYSPILRLLRL